MTLILDKTHNFTKTQLPKKFSQILVGKTSGTISDVIVSYLPKAFETLTRGIHTRDVRAQVLKMLPLFDKPLLDLVCSYLDNRLTLLYLLDHLADKTAIMAKLMDCIEKRDWDNPIFRTPNGDQYLLEAVRQGLLTEFEFSSLSLVRTAALQWNRPPRIELLFEDGGVNEDTLDLVTESFKVPKKNEALTGKNPAPLLTPDQVEDFLLELQQFPATEHFVSLQPYSALPNNHIFPNIQDLAMNLFGQVNSPQQVDGRSFFGKNVSMTVPTSMMIAPLGMIQAFLNVKFQENAVQLVPVIGPVGVSELRENGLHGTRVASLHHSILAELTGLTLSIMADGLFAPGVYFTYHDACFHAYLSSSVSRALCQRYVQFTDVMKDKRANLVIPEDAGSEPFYRKVGFKFTDMEHPAFRPEIFASRKPIDQNALQVFWHEIATDLEHLTDTGLPGTKAYARATQLGKFLQKQGLITQEDRTAIAAEQQRTRNIKNKTEREISRILGYLLEGAKQ